MKRFADGGFNSSIGSSTASGNDAFSGLGQLNQGTQQLGNSLNTIQTALGSPSPQSNMQSSPQLASSTNSNMTKVKKGGAIKSFKKGGRVSASNRADGIALKGFTRGKYC